MKTRARHRRYPWHVRIDLTPRSAVLAVITVAVVWLSTILWPVLIAVVMALMLVGMLAPLVTWLEHRKMRRGYAIATVFGSMVVVALGLGAFTAPRLFAQVADIVDHLPKMQAEVVSKLEQSKMLAPLAQSVKSTRTSELIGNMARLGITYSSQVLLGVGYFFTSVFLALYLMIDRDPIRGGIFALIPREYHVRASRILLNLETIVGGYMRGQAITSALMAVFTFALLMIARVPNAIALAVLAGAADVLPYVGGLLACGPAVLAASMQGTAPGIAVLIALVVYQEFESRFIVPRVYGSVLRLPSSMVVLALLIGGTLLGILGALLALPVAAGIRMVVEELRFEFPGDDSDDGVLRERDEQAERVFAERSAGAAPERSAAIATEIAEQRLQQEADDPAQAAEIPITRGKP